MTNLFEEIAGLDRLIHEPARLAILTALLACEAADFTFLRRPHRANSREPFQSSGEAGRSRGRGRREKIRQ